MSRKNLPRYKSNGYFAKFKVDWIDERTGWGDQRDRELIALFKDNGELTPDSEVTIKYKYSSLNRREREVCWERSTREGKESVVLGEIDFDEYFLYFLEKFLMRWHGGYKKTSYCVMKAICKFYQQNPTEFRKMANKAKNLQEFIALIGIR